ncbi:MAG TPA: acyl-CoA dehydrogenase family protein, partial [Streptosporangiaceae bacterium]
MSEVTAARQPLDLLYSETETELRGAVRSLLEARASWRDVLARTETADTYDLKLWHTLAAEVGAAGLIVPESLGGAGASYREAAVVAGEIGRAVAPVPFLGAVVATTALLASGADDLVRELAGGAVNAALVLPFAAGPGARSATSAGTVRLSGPQPGDEPGSYRLTGTVPGVADALPADVLLVPADGVPFGLYEVRAGEPGVTRVPVVSLDQTRQLCDVTFDGALAR